MLHELGRSPCVWIWPVFVWKRLNTSLSTGTRPLTLEPVHTEPFMGTQPSVSRATPQAYLHQPDPSETLPISSRPMGSLERANSHQFKLFTLLTVVTQLLLCAQSGLYTTMAASGFVFTLRVSATKRSTVAVVFSQTEVTSCFISKDETERR